MCAVGQAGVGGEVDVGYMYPTCPGGAGPAGVGRHLGQGQGAPGAPSAALAPPEKGGEDARQTGHSLGGGGAGAGTKDHSACCVAGGGGGGRVGGLPSTRLTPPPSAVPLARAFAACVARARGVDPDDAGAGTATAWCGYGCCVDHGPQFRVRRRCRWRINAEWRVRMDGGIGSIRLHQRGCLYKQRYIPRP